MLRLVEVGRKRERRFEQKAVLRRNLHMPKFTQFEFLEHVAGPAVDHPHFLPVRVDQSNVAGRFETAPTVDGQVALRGEVDTMASLAARQSLLLAAIDAHAQPIGRDRRSLAGREVNPARLFIDAADVANLPVTLRDRPPLFRSRVERVQMLPAAALAENDDFVLHPPRSARVCRPRPWSFRETAAPISSHPAGTCKSRAMSVRGPAHRSRAASPSGCQPTCVIRKLSAV